MGTRGRNTIWTYGAGAKERSEAPARPPSIIRELVKLIVNLIILTGLVYAAMYVWQTSASREVTVPSLQGVDRQAAEELLRSTDLEFSVVANKPSETVAAGKVLRTDPNGGSRVKLGRKIKLVLSTGSQWSKVPDITQMSERRAEELLADRSLTIGKVKFIYHSKLTRGFVVAQYPPANRRVMRNSGVDMLISRGPRPGTEEDTAPSTSDEGLLEPDAGRMR